MRMTFRAISLRPVLETDLPFLFQLLGDPTRVHLWLRGRPVYDEAGFRQTWSAWTSGMMGAKFIIGCAARPVGLVLDHDRSLVGANRQCPHPRSPFPQERR